VASVHGAIRNRYRGAILSVGETVPPGRARWSTDRSSNDAGTPPGKNVGGG
jgi:hypothetical protein